ncbi:Extracellular serine protease precursor [Serratia entomophila]|uniref:autotransporter domain-containing protein n=1 Tax=Serratia entomophila TaxID=42906 RepID=UPI00217B7BEF|nr:autotransporter domain-containing protein [Serratia entomophila]CAI1941800.1 Extracellular serine protease precursor [Serratia entomophila]
MTDNKSSAGLRRRQRSMQAVRYITLATALSAGASWAQSVTVTGDASASPTPNPIPHWDYTHFLELVIGNSGEGELAIENGGTMTSGLYPGHRVILGKLAGSSGAATVSGLGSLWKHLGVIRVGDGGRGELNVVDGGGVSASDIEVGIGGLSILNGGTVSAVDVSAQNENSAIRGSGAGSHLQSSLSVSAGSAQIDEGGQVSGKSGDIGGNGAITVSGPGSRWTVDGYLGIGFGGTGSLLIENGGAVVTTDDSGYIMLGHNRDTGYGNVRVTGQGSVWDLAGKLYIGNTGNASVTVDDGGRIIARGEAWIASDPSSTSNLTVENGGRFSSDRLVVGNYGEGTLNLRNGGELSVRLLDLGWRGFGSSIMNIGSASNDPADAVAAGRLNTEYVSLRDNAVLNFNHTGDGLKIDGNVIGSGRLNHISGTTRVRTMYGAFQPLIVSGGNLIIEQVSNLYGKLAILSGASLAVDARHGESSIYATLTGGGNLTKSGDEKLEFWGDGSGFTGDTRVTAGELQVFSELGGKADVSGGRLSLFRNDDYGTAGTVGGSVTASGDGTVAGNGIIKGDLTFNRGGVLEGEQGQRLHVDGALKLDRDSQVNVGLSSAPSPALFKVAGDLTLDGTLNVSDQGGFGAGIYRLFDYGGRLFDNGLAIGKTPTGVTADHLAIQTAIYGQVNLASTAGATLSFWDGGDAGKHNNSQVDGGSGVWRADGRNWTDVSGALNGPYQPNPSFAIFQGEAGTVTVDHAVGAIAATGMQFASDGYRIEGDSIDLQGADGETFIRVGNGAADGAAMTATIAADLSGDSKLVKHDYGTLILSGDNRYTGGTELRGGTLQVSADRNLGAAGGELAFTGGTLKTESRFDTNRNVLLSQYGRFDVAADGELGLSGRVSGRGDLLKSGAGTLRLDNVSNDYGNTLVQEGTLIGNAGSISGNVANAATLVFDQASDASFAGNIGALGETKGKMVKQGAGSLNLGGISAIDWSIHAGDLTTAAERFRGNANIASGASLTFDQSGGGSYAGSLNGTGLFVKNGGGTLWMDEDSAGFRGLTQVNDGRLALDGKLGGSMLVQSGGVLSGTGTLGSGAGSTLTIADQGVLSPGGEFSTLKVDGDLIFQQGSRFEVAVDPAGKEANLVQVTGNAGLEGGTVAHIGANGHYQLRSSHTILAADGRLSGAFDDVTSDFAFLTPELSYDYDAGTVDLRLARNHREFASAAFTRNQIATANAIESIGLWAGHAVYDAIAQLPDDVPLIRESFDQLSGEVHASMKNALIDESRFVRDAATDRLRAASGDAVASAATVMSYEGGQPQQVSPTTDGLAVWGQSFGSWGKTDSDGNAASLKRSTGGVLFGVDTPAFDSWRFGVMTGYSRTRADVGKRASSGNSDNYHLGAYGGGSWKLAENTLSLRTGIAHSWHDIETRRSVSLPGFNDSLTGDYRAGTFQAFGDLGYRIDLAPLSFEPFVNLAHTRLRTQGFGEKGGAAALHGKAQNTDATFATLGLRSSAQLETAVGTATLNGTLGWRHAMGDTTPLSTHAFSAGDAFTVAGAPVAKDALQLEAGVKMAITPSASVGVSYDGQVSGSAQQHGVKAGFSFSF